jgi:hypothetical protein
MFFNKKYTYASAKKLITEAKELLGNIKEKEKLEFLEMLQLRVDDFESVLQEEHSADEKEIIIEQYNRFAKTLHSCLSRPEYTFIYTLSYHNYKYYPIGVEAQPEPIRHNISLAAIILGLALILASLAAFAFNPTIGAILLPIGITLLIPGSFSFMTPGIPDCSAKKMEEKIIFETGAKLMKPSVIFEDTQLDNELAYTNTM